MKGKRERGPRIVIEIHQELLFNIKKRALFKNITMRKWVILAILDKIKEEMKYE